MAEFKIGDKVRYNSAGVAWSSNPQWDGVEGVVEESSSYNYTVRIKLTKVNDYVRNENWNTFTEGDVVNIQVKSLELLPQFGYADIKVGDVIRRTYKTGGYTEIREGEVTKKGVYSAQANLGKDFPHTGVAFNTDDSSENITLELVSRPERHWSEEIEVGAVGYYESSRMPKVFYKTGDNVWKVTYLDDNTMYDFKDVKALKEGFGSITNKDQINWISK